MGTPAPATSASNRRQHPSASPAAIQRPSGDDANLASDPKEEDGFDDEPPGDPPPPPAAFFRVRRFDRAPSSYECVAPKNPTSTLAIRSATVRASTLRSLGAVRTHVTVSPSKSLHSRRGRSDAPAAPPTSTALSRIIPSANPQKRRNPPPSNASAVTAVPGEGERLARICA
jgi:hypothetical protein